VGAQKIASCAKDHFLFPGWPSPAPFILTTNELAEQLQNDITLTPTYVSELKALRERGKGGKAKGTRVKKREEQLWLLAKLRCLLELGTYTSQIKPTLQRDLEEDHDLWDDLNPSPKVGSAHRTEAGLKMSDGNLFIEVPRRNLISYKEANAMDRLVVKAAAEAKAKRPGRCPYAGQVAISLARLLLSVDAQIRELAAGLLSDFAYECCAKLERVGEFVRAVNCARKFLVRN
jgi:hypothetical protein